MFKSKYSTLLTVFLIVLIVAIIVVGLILGINTYKNYKNDTDAKKAFAERPKENTNNKTENQTVEEDNSTDKIGNIEMPEGIEENQDSNNSSTTSSQKVKFYKNFPMAGYIEIPKTGISYPILLDTSASALETAVGITYPSSPTLNEPGNVVIIGHNYRNGKFFANNKNLQTGDIIKITDLTGKTLEYTIYEIFQTTPTDTAYMTKDRGENIEISLSTCTDDGNNRLVILARAQ